MTRPLAFGYCVIKICYSSESKLQDCHVSINQRKKEISQLANSYFAANAVITLTRKVNFVNTLCGIREFTKPRQQHQPERHLKFQKASLVSVRYL